MSGSCRPARLGAAAAFATLVFAGLPGAANAQSGRAATLPSPPPDASTSHPWPTRVRDDGSVIVEVARGYEYVVRSCAYYVELVRQRRLAQRRAVHAAPQGGSGQRPPGASGLPRAPGLPALPGGGDAGRAASGAQASRVNPSRSAPSVPRIHSSGLPYHNGICHVRDAYGRLRLIPL